MKKKRTCYFGFFDGKRRVYPRLDITVSEEDNIHNGEVLVEFKNDNIFMPREDAIRYFEWVIDQLNTLSDIQDK